MRALVTGATGFIGRHLVEALRQRHWELVCVVRRPVRAVDPSIRCIVGDLLRPETLSYRLDAIGSVDAVFHLGAMLPISDPQPNAGDYLIANALATEQLLRTSAALAARSFVYTSSLAVIGMPRHLPIGEDHVASPTHPYLIAKLAGEQFCEIARRNERRRVTSLRITSPYGPGMPEMAVLPRFVRRALASEDILWFGSGNRTQNFVHVDDVARACLCAAEAAVAGVYDIGGAESISMHELANLIIRLTPGTRSRACAAGAPDPQDCYRWEVDISRARAELGFEPKVSIAEGLAEYVEAVSAGSTPPQWWVKP